MRSASGTRRSRSHSRRHSVSRFPDARERSKRTNSRDSESREPSSDSDTSTSDDSNESHDHYEDFVDEDDQTDHQSNIRNKNRVGFDPHKHERVYKLMGSMRDYVYKNFHLHEKDNIIKQKVLKDTPIPANAVHVFVPPDLDFFFGNSGYG